MSLEKELSELRRFKGQINYLNKKISELYKEKQNCKEKMELYRINKEIEDSKKMLTYYEEEIQILEIITSTSNKREKQEEKSKPETDLEVQEIQQLKSKKDKLQHLNLKESKLKRNFMQLLLGDDYNPDDYPPVNLNKDSKKSIIKSLFYTGKHTKQNKFVAKNKEMGQKIKKLCSKCKEKYGPKLNEYKDITKSTVKEVTNTTVSGLKTLFNKGKEGIRNLFNRPRNIGEKRFTGIGIKRKIKAILLATSIGLTYPSSIVGATIQSLKNNVPHSIEDSSIRGNKHNSENIFAKLMDEEGITFDLEGKDETTKEETTKIEETPKEDVPWLDEDSKIIYKPSDIDIPENVEDNNANKGKHVDLRKINSKDQIKTIYGGEISASENGIRTKSDILFAATQMGWSKDRIENIKEMMPGLLKMQIDFDIDPLCALAVFQWESGCGTAYTKYGQIRPANIRDWNGQIGVIGHSKIENYTLYSDFSSAAYDFGNYLRNGPPYANSSKGAQTMADLEFFNGMTAIFVGAATKDAATYNQLKACLEKRVTLSDISNATRLLTSSEIKEMTNTITSSINKQKSASKAMSGR